VALLDSFERRALFGLTRVMALFIIALLILGLVSGAIFFGWTWTRTSDRHVKPDAVISAIKPPSAPADDSAPDNHAAADESNSATEAQFPGLKIPFSLQRYFAIKEFRDAIANKLNGMTLADQQDYLNNMGEVLDATKSAGIQPGEAVDKYIKLKDSLIEASAAENSTRTQARLYIIAGAGSTLGLIGLFSLILVLLAIERNTRVHPTGVTGL
jgi:hypothetical protein